MQTREERDAIDDVVREFRTKRGCRMLAEARRHLREFDEAWDRLTAEVGNCQRSIDEARRQRLGAGGSLHNLEVLVNRQGNMRGLRAVRERQLSDATTVARNQLRMMLASVAAQFDCEGEIEALIDDVISGGPGRG